MRGRLILIGTLLALSACGTAKAGEPEPYKCPEPCTRDDGHVYTDDEQSVMETGETALALLPEKIRNDITAAFINDDIDTKCDYLAAAATNVRGMLDIGTPAWHVIDAILGLTVEWDGIPELKSECRESLQEALDAIDHATGRD